ncbi:MAG: hypothetical protein U0183_13480 [Polyangiaceae bacterium]
MRKSLGVAVAALTLGALAPSAAEAAPKLRRQWNLHGDFVLVGNTLGQECRTGSQAAPAPVVGTVGACGLNTADSAYDVFWRSEDPANGQATASSSVTLANARSSAFLGTGARRNVELPAGARIVHAQLYWAATLLAAPAKRTVVLDRPGGFQATVNADESLTVPAGGNVYYQNTADVTALVRAQGPGTYRVSGFDSQPVVDQTINDAFAGWTLVVVYDSPAEPVRNVTLFDGLTFVDLGASATVNLAGFLVPTMGFDAKLGVLAYEGDDGGTGDSLAFKSKSAAAPTLLGDALNPSSNLFNGTRSVFGLPVSVPGDLPRQTGGARSMSGFDMDVLDITPLVRAGDDSATITASSTSDKYAIGALVTSISTLAPDLSSTTKTVRPIVSRPGDAVFVGDTVEFELTVRNTGNDDALDVTLTDVLPIGFTYVAGSTSVVNGPLSGTKTDARDSDGVDFDSASRTLVVRLGAGADGTKGGSLAIGESQTVRFRATVAAGQGGQVLTNQAKVAGRGLHGSPRDEWASDSGDGGLPEATAVPVDTCALDAECPGTRCSRTRPYACEICNGDFASGASQPCIDATRPACNTQGAARGACSECTAVNVSRCTTAASPTCNTVSGSCAPCLADYGAASSRACPKVTAPVCLVAGAKAGQCVECATSQECTGARPVCTTSNVCEGCTSDFGSAGPKACPTSTLPFCGATGACGKCSSNADCVGRAGPICNLTTGSCGAVCTVDTDCRTTEFCAAGSCTPKAKNGDPLSPVAPISGECSPQNGARACLSASCFEPDDRCGLPNAEPCGPPTNDAVCRSGVCFQRDAKCGLPKGEACTLASVCRSGICAPSGTCGECRVDTDCGGPASGRVCDERTGTCGDGCRGQGGNGCAPPKVCTSRDSERGACVDPVRDAGADAADPPRVEDAGPSAPDAAADSGAQPPEVAQDSGDVSGCACDMSHTRDVPRGSLWLALGAGLAAFLSRRRRERDTSTR